jgi:hypothetical protein
LISQCVGGILGGIAGLVDLDTPNGTE